MQSPLATFINEKTPAGISIGMSRLNVARVLKEPSCWEGHLPVRANDSNVWSYGCLQIVFDNEHVSAIAIFFETLDNMRGATDISTDQVVGADVDSSTTIEEFEQLLRESGIEFERETNTARQPVLRIPDGVVARFSRQSDYDRSVAEGRPVTSQQRRLVSIKVEKNQLVDNS